MKQDILIYTSYVSPENLKRVTENNLLPIFVIRDIRKSELIGKYTETPLHFKKFSPSSHLYQEFRDGLIDFTEYTKKFIIELSNINLEDEIKKLARLISLSDTDGAVLMGYGSSYNTSHRKILSDLLNNSDILTLPITELNYEEFTTRS